MPAYIARLLSTQIVGLVILNVLIGLTIPVIDNTAHVSGLVAGLALGWFGAGAVSARLASVVIDDRAVVEARPGRPLRLVRAGRGRRHDGPRA